MKADYINGVEDGIKCIKRGFIDNQELYNSSYNAGFAMLCRATGLDEKTAKIVILSGGFIADKEKICEVLFNADQCMSNGGEISEMY